MARRHLAIFLRGTADKILSGEKFVEIRLSEAKIDPYLKVNKEDEIYLKDSGCRVSGKVTVDNCLYYDNLKQEDIQSLKEKYSEATSIDEDFWKKHRKARYATIIFLRNPQKFLAPINIKKNDRRAWVVLEEE
jgi:predicted transcriptional regulator